MSKHTTGVTNFRTIVAADSVLADVETARETFAAWIAKWADKYGPHIGDGKPANGTPHKEFADGINAACTESGKTAKATEHIRSRVGRTLRVIAAAPKGAEETDAAFHARILSARTWVTTASQDEINKRIAGVTPRAPRPKSPKSPKSPKTPDAPKTPETPETPVLTVVDTHNALMAALTVHMDTLAAHHKAGGKVTKAMVTAEQTKIAVLLSFYSPATDAPKVDAPKVTRKAKTA